MGKYKRMKKNQSHLKIGSIIIYVAICLILTLSCSSEDRELIAVDMDAPSGNIDLKLSDMLTDIKIVLLETGDGAPLVSGGGMGGGGFRVSCKYIVHYSSSALHLFDSNGKYLKLLAVAGGGPNEFRNISGVLIDDIRNVVYYNDIKDRTMIYRIDLVSGRHLEPIEMLLDGKNFLAFDIDNSGDIYGFFASGVGNLMFIGGSEDSKVEIPYIAHKYNVEKNTVEGIAVPAAFSSTGNNRGIAKYGESMPIYDLSYSDTLFFYTKGVLSPTMTIKMRDILVDPMDGGNSLSVNLVGDKGFLLYHYYSKIDVETGASGEISSVSVKRPRGTYMFADKSSGELLTVKSFYIDPIDATIDISSIKVAGDYGYCYIDAYKMETFIEEATAGDKLQEKEKDVLRKLAATITEDSNPVVIMGKIK